VTPEPPDGHGWLLAFDAEAARTLPLPVAARHILDAQAALESGWGTASAFRRGLNFGNVTHHEGDGWHGDSWVEPGADWEYYLDARGVRQRRRISQCWRIYPTLSAAIEDHYALLGWPRYIAARRALLLGDAAGFCHELGPDAGRGRGGYYTLDEATYRAGLLERLAVVSRTLTPPPPEPTPPNA